MEAAHNSRAKSTIEEADSKIDGALEQFDEWNRWKRVEAALISGNDPVLAKLQERHAIELIATSGSTKQGNDPRRVWWPQDENDLPTTLEPESPDGAATNLVVGIEALTAQHQSDQRLAVVLLSDGQHNATNALKASPLQLARQLSKRGVPVYTVGYGASTPPRDLAVLSVKGPESLFIDDRVKGEIVMKDNMPAGSPLSLKIEIEGETVWQKNWRPTMPAVGASNLIFRSSHWSKIAAVARRMKA